MVNSLSWCVIHTILPSITENIFKKSVLLLMMCKMYSSAIPFLVCQLVCNCQILWWTTQKFVTNETAEVGSISPDRWVSQGDLLMRRTPVYTNLTYLCQNRHKNRFVCSWCVQCFCVSPCWHGIIPPTVINFENQYFTITCSHNNFASVW